ncbi:Cof subfamily protein (haloacid dehalogenase superfamily) [Bacillus ectoiniformans]|uniref:Cof-type HAD-IIB family hydrolase n=1 Tax=Bacillus ectoiniformans TaxID=1494429 RepID=UPI00195D35BD|nr:Cof-type HAD-IIB family hydrolase [Bacillus ectoiniformans]MBM7648295.1 Cof subfamily protein (haloacid dehalogenase superfamily) [Bacillus ectoiniformans]
MIKCIATDMDGTLLNGKMDVSEQNREAIKKAQSEGVEVIVATGRSYSEARFALDEADIDCPIICANGAEVRDEFGNIVSQAYMEKSQVHDIYQILKEMNLYYELYTNQETYTANYEAALDIMVDVYLTAHTEVPREEIREAAKERFTKGHVHLVDDYQQVIDDESQFIYKFLVFSFDKDELEETASRLNRIARLTVSSSGSENLELTHCDAQKGIALERFVDKKGIKLEETMAIGDNFNDVSMLEKVGRSVAMGNALPEIKAICDYETSSNDEDGVAEAIIQALTTDTRTIEKR